MLASWWGAKNGGRTISSSPGSRAPASEWIAVSSSDSSTERSGRIPGSRSARDVFPEPFGPESIRWWPPAAATSSAYFTSGTPFEVGQVVLVSRREPRHSISRLPDIGATGGASGTDLAAQLGPHLGQRPHAEHRHAGHHRRLARLRLGHDHPLEAAARRGHHHRQHARAPTAARR